WHTQQRRVLYLAAEDPPEYTAWLARVLDVDPGHMTFYRQALQLNPSTLQHICGTIHAAHYGLVLIASWQTIISSLVKDENDNAGSVRVVREVRAAARASGILWLIDAHAGKSEDQREDADPALALRGASSAAGEVDFLLSLRYADTP